jgi:hypothetical protein
MGRISEGSPLSRAAGKLGICPFFFRIEQGSIVKAEEIRCSSNLFTLE